jgi:hypothetical protein
MEAEPLAGLTPRRLALLGAGLSFGVALLFRGHVHPDEVFQVLEPAHRSVFGYGIEAWEWRVGLRNRAVVDAVALLLRLLSALGSTRPQVWAAGIWLLCSAWQAVGLLSLYRLVESRAGAGPARLATFILATWGGYAIYASRPLGDALAVPALLLALELVQRSRRVGDGLGAGAMLGLAVVFRYPSLVFALPLGLGALATRRPGVILGFVAGFATVLGLLGLLDWHTWGEPFHSLRAYASFNQPQGEVVHSFGTQPWWWYLPVFGAMAPYFLAWQLLRGLRAQRLAAACFGIYVVLVEAHPHKESRFLLPLVPLGLAIAAGPAWETLLQLQARGRRWRLGLATVYAGWSVLALTVMRPFDLLAAETQAELALRQDPELTGMLVVGDFWDSGGYFYLHQQVPLDFVGPTDARLGLEALNRSDYSHLMVVQDTEHPRHIEPTGWRVVWDDGPGKVWKRPDAHRPGAAPRDSIAQSRR